MTNDPAVRVVEPQAVREAGDDVAGAYEDARVAVDRARHCLNAAWHEAKFAGIRPPEPCASIGTVEEVIAYLEDVLAAWSPPERLTMEAEE